MVLGEQGERFFSLVLVRVYRFRGDGSQLIRLRYFNTFACHRYEEETLHMFAGLASFLFHHIFHGEHW